MTHGKNENFSKLLLHITKLVVYFTANELWQK